MPAGDSAVADDDEDEDEKDIAPLPDINRSRSMRTSFGAGGKDARPRAFSSGAAGSATQVRKRAASAAGQPAPASAGDGVPPTGASSPPTAFTALGPTVSRMSSMSARTFVDPVALVSMPTLTREETRTMRRARARAGTVTTMASLARMVSSQTVDEKPKGGEEEEGVEELVAVQITDDGEEIIYPDGGIEVSGNAKAVETSSRTRPGRASLAASARRCALSASRRQSAPSSRTTARTCWRSILREWRAAGVVRVELTQPSSTIAWIGSAQAAVCFGLCIFTGPLFDRYGCRPLLATGTLLLVLAFCMLSLATKYYQIFLCHATLMALGADLMFVSGTVFACHLVSR